MIFLQNKHFKLEIEKNLKLSLYENGSGTHPQGYAA
jgi:hypothetical protein